MIFINYQFGSYERMKNCGDKVHEKKENNKVCENDLENEREENMTTTRKKKTVFKKTDTYEMLLELYKIAAAEGRGYGSMKTQLTSSTLFGMAVLLTFSTFIYYLAKDGFLGNVNIVIFVMFLALMVVFLFIAFGAYILYLQRVQRTFITTTVVIEKLLREVVSGEKNEDELRDEILDKFPYLRVIDKMELKKSRWFKRTVKWQGEEDFFE